MRVETPRARARRAIASLLVACALARGAAGAKSIDVALRAGWRATSFALETLVGVADVDGAAFWTLVDDLDAPIDGDASDDATCEARVDEAGRRALGDDGRARALGLARGARAYSPRLASFRTMAAALSDASGGCCRVELGGAVYDDAGALEGAVRAGAASASGSATERDATYGGALNATLPTAFAYAAPGTACFNSMHRVLVDASESGLVNYVLRPVLFETACARRDSCAAFGASDDANLRLAGFGVELAVKNMEYKAIDDSKVKAEEADADDDASAPLGDELADESVSGFNFATLAKRYPNEVDGLRAFRDEMVGKSELTSDAPLKLWDIKDLGLQATQRISLSDDPLRALVELSQNFPSLANSLSRMKLNSTIVNEVTKNRKNMRPGGLIMSLNGENLELDTIDIYTLTETISKEVQHAAALRRLGLPQSSVSRLLRLPKKQRSSEVKIDVTNPAILFYNDIEADAKFASWTRNLKTLLEPSRGGFPKVRYNLYNMAVFLDPSDMSTWDMVGMMSHFYDHKVPVRMAQVVVTGLDNPDPVLAQTFAKQTDLVFGRRVARAANYLLREYGPVAQHNFMSYVAQSRTEERPPSYFAPAVYSPPSWEGAMDAFEKTLSEFADDLEFDAVTLLEEFASRSSTSIDKYIDEVRAAVKAKGLMTQSFVLNGVYVDESQGMAYRASLEQMVSHHLRQEMEKVRRLVVAGKLAGALLENVAKFMQEGAVSKYVPWILDEDDVAPVYRLPIDRSSIASFKYAQGGDADEVKGMSIVVVANADSDRGALLILAAAKHVLSESGSLSRFTVVHPSAAATMGARSRAIQAALHLPTRRAKIANFVEQLLAEDVKPEDAAERMGLNLVDFKRLYSDETLFADVATQSLRLLAHYDLTSKCAVIANGRVLDLMARQCQMDAEDLDVLAAIEMTKTSKMVFDVVKEEILSDAEEMEPALLSTIISDAAAIVAMKQAGASTKRTVESLEEIINDAKATSFVTGSGTIVQIEAILDPLSKEAQRVAPVLALLRDRLPEAVTIRVVLNPMTNLQDLPLKSYYRYVAPPSSMTESPRAFITNVPTHKTLTMHVDFPEAWMVTTHRAAYDLDNLILKDIKEKTVHAEYLLESLLVTGHASDHNTGQPARGTQFVLEDKSVAVNPGTIVMSNLGYFQLPASPGMHKLSLRAGRSSDIFAFLQVKDLLDSEARDLTLSHDESTVDVLVDSFRGRQLDVSLARRKGKEDLDVLDEVSTSDNSGWLSSVFKRTKEADRIHIFSVASGHLYERFLKIMMASVKRSTKNPVKFWFIKNWLSPSFKDFLPYMAKEYDFEYELVSYKWPTWLNKQTEKQRIIWAYKILFLDVLFPLELNKVIFVDADQIVRADMSELWTMDLHGAPYGYTPMCDNNKEMEGFRFWKQGFWRDHLRGRPYHISALYVVDLDRFRAMAAGDRLRVMYDQLSRDPGSLANLDQDLPNYAQHDVPIFSLPQPWLWCESWCGNETKSAAKTIDLCNNPLTKEPKLEGARRIVQEWPGLDAEVRAFTERVEERMRVGDKTEDVKDEL